MSNEKKLTPELLEKAKAVPSAAALFTLAQESGIDLTAEEAALHFAQLHPKAGVLSDEELNNVSGGIPVVRCDGAKCVSFPKVPTPGNSIAPP
ncbi:MAG: hypothetical protein RSF88_11210 [Lachnospiraceae bacterium]